MFSVWDDLRRAVFSIFPFSSRMHFIRRYRRVGAAWRGERSMRRGMTGRLTPVLHENRHFCGKSSGALHFSTRGGKDKRVTCYLTRPQPFPIPRLPTHLPQVARLCVFAALRKLFNIRSNYSLWRRIKSFLLVVSPARRRAVPPASFPFISNCFFVATPAYRAGNILPRADKSKEKESH